MGVWRGRREVDMAAPARFNQAAVANLERDEMRSGEMMVTLESQERD